MNNDDLNDFLKTGERSWAKYKPNLMPYMATNKPKDKFGGIKEFIWNLPTTIYIAVHVEYDYHRFQVNKYAHTNKEKVLKYINQNPLPIIPGIDEPLILEYELNQIPEIVNQQEIEHWWIQVIEMDS